MSKNNHIVCPITTTQEKNRTHESTQRPNMYVNSPKCDLNKKSGGKLEIVIVLVQREKNVLTATQKVPNDWNERCIQTNNIRPPPHKHIYHQNFHKPFQPNTAPIHSIFAQHPNNRRFLPFFFASFHLSSSSLTLFGAITNKLFIPFSVKDSSTISCFVCLISGCSFQDQCKGSFK